MIATLTPLEMALLDRWQRDFPLEARPFAVLASALAVEEATVLERLAAFRRQGLISRVGAVVRPNTAGASTLAAMAVPPARLEAVADRVNAEPAVNHNYQREHDLNLWFVVAAADPAAVAETLAGISRDSGLEVLDLPLERAYHIDLGFGLEGRDRCTRRYVAGGAAPTIEADAADRRLLSAIEDGLPLVPRPFAKIAQSLGWTETEALDRLRRLCAGGVVSRFGLVVRHRSLGYRANAMAVWDVPDDGVDRVAADFAGQSFVTLCYRRPRRRPRWPYNLFCMIHGRDRLTVEAQVGRLNDIAGTRALPQAVLFSRRCFKQRGARFSGEAKEAAA